MANQDNPTQLSLGRVSTNAPLIHSVAQQLTSPPSAVDGLLAIGKTLAGGLVKEQKQKEFYEGQDRILQASLEGTQKEELKNILDEQPYYMKMLGNGAVAEGAIEMASRVGAGKIFNEGLARLNTGQDAQIDPDTYKTNVMSQINSQRTGSPTVDSIMIPQMISKGQSLIAAHLSKHLEFNANTARRNGVDSTMNAFSSYKDAVTHETGKQDIVQTEGVPAELMPATSKAAYHNLVDTLNPLTRPLNVEEEGWTQDQLAVAIPSLERGDTVYYQAMKESGMYGRLSAPDRIKADVARDTGVKLNDSNNMTFLHKETTQIMDDVHNVKDDAGIEGIYNKAVAINAKYVAAGITPPDIFKDRDNINSWIKEATTAKHTYEAKLERQNAANDKLAKITSDAAAGVQQQFEFNAGIIRNASGGNPTGAVNVANADGTVSQVYPTKEQRTDAYTTWVSSIMQMPNKKDRDEAYASKHVTGKVQLAELMQIDDEGTKGRLTQLLRTVVGQVPNEKTTSSAINKSIGEAIQTIDYLRSNLRPETVKNYFPDENLQKNYLKFDNIMKVTGDTSLAYEGSFGAIQGVEVKYDEMKLKKTYTSKDYVTAIEDAGNQSFEVRAWLDSEAKNNMLGHSANEADAMTLALSSLKGYTEKLAGNTVLGVPSDRRLSAMVGVADKPEMADAALDLYARTRLNLHDDESYTVAFSARLNNNAGGHVLTPINSDGNALPSMSFVLPYTDIQKLLNSKEYHDKVVKHRAQFKSHQSGRVVSAGKGAYVLK